MLHVFLGVDQVQLFLSSRLTYIDTRTFTYTDTFWKTDGPTPHVFVYHGPLVRPLLGVVSSTFTKVYLSNIPDMTRLLKRQCHLSPPTRPASA